MEFVRNSALLDCWWHSVNLDHRCWHCVWPHGWAAANTSGSAEQNWHLHQILCEYCTIKSIQIGVYRSNMYIMWRCWPLWEKPWLINAEQYTDHAHLLKKASHRLSAVHVIVIYIMQQLPSAFCEKHSQSWSSFFCQGFFFPSCNAPTVIDDCKKKKKEHLYYHVQ